MSYELQDTIAAVATAAGGAARGIIRISGPQAVATVAKCFEAAYQRPLEQLRRATAVRGQVRAAFGETAPRFVPCDVLLWPTDRSYTRQPVAELHTLGSPPLLQGVLEAVCDAGARVAEPGEFTLRAFLAGRLDLTQAEAVLGVIDAHGADELGGALAQLAGGLTRPLNRLRDDLVQLLAELEAGLDFVEEDIEFISRKQLQERLCAAAELLEETIAQMSSRHVAAPAEQVVLMGPPNVGKSSLFNALVAARGAGRSVADRAIVSPQRGTTRDYVTASLDLDGIRCELVDTAGVDAGGVALEHAVTPVDRAAQAMTAERRERAALRTLCVEASAGIQDAAPWQSDSQPIAAAARHVDVIVLTKSDLDPHTAQPNELPADVPVVVTSSVSGQGLDELCSTWRRLLSRDTTAARGGVVAATADRCRESLRLAEAAVARAAQTVEFGAGEELVAAELRDALHELGRVVGAIYTDDLLDRIFKTFCIGK
jgi:tRNA modification GTPase